uniref:Metalloendopeptidase n=1 Tax=Strongyloides papillosus TaxID=174720 RepID=A0A0N5CDN0_STREA
MNRIHSLKNNNSSRVEELITSLSDKQLRSKRSGIRADVEKINFPVHYCINLNPPITTYKLLDVNATILKNAIKQLEDRTCLQFYYRSPCHTTNEYPYRLIYFVANTKIRINEYNFTYTSKVPNPYYIKIEDKCNKQVGCFLKKILAYLGFFLTHKRSDRDDYITVNDSNIISEYKYEYDKFTYNSSLADIGYDFGSVMHVSKFYRNFWFGDTFKTKLSPYYELMTGQEYGLSFSDYKFINYRYCQESCFNAVKCERGGYPNSDSCRYCECPNGFAGLQCEILDNSTLGCGQNQLNASSQLSTLNFSGIETCNVLITAGIGIKIKIVVTLAHLPPGNPCFEKQALEIKHRKDKSLTGLCLCTYASNVTLESEDHEVFIQYNGKDKNHNAKIEYQAITS